MTKLALLMGAGDLASRLQPLLKNQGFDVIGARRQPQKAASKDQSSSAHYQVVQADGSSADDWLKLLAHKPALIVITLTPTDYSDKGYQQGYVKPTESLRMALSECDPSYRPFIVFVSSTSVYGERAGEWVNETTAAKPSSFAGKRLLQAEEQIAHSQCPYTLVRFSGIYGPGREGMIARLISGEVKLTPAWTNRIHARDAVGIIAHLVSRHSEGLAVETLYIGTDNLPIRQADFATALAQHLGLDPEQLPATDQIGPRGSKRLSNARISDAGYRFIFPTWKEGYEAL